MPRVPELGRETAAAIRHAGCGVRYRRRASGSVGDPADVERMR